MLREAEERLPLNELRRVSVTIGGDEAEAARARMLELFPEGFEEAERGNRIVLSAYTHAEGEARARAAFDRVDSIVVPPDWEERWKRFHRPVQAGGIWIVPPWERGTHAGLSVTIDPGRAFGTGGHPTTRLALELLADLDPTSLLDVGCGSGVLAIAAAKLGFAPVVAIDREAAAVAATRRNAAANQVEIDCRQLDATRDALPAADVAVANISERVVAAVAPRLRSAFLVSSGYFEPYVPALAGFRRTARRTLEGWAADLHVRE